MVVFVHLVLFVVEVRFCQFFQYFVFNFILIMFRTFFVADISLVVRTPRNVV